MQASLALPLSASLGIGSLAASAEGAKEAARGGGHVMSNILFSEVASIYTLFRNRKRHVTIYKGPATEPSTKIKSIGSDACLVDLRPPISQQQSVTFISEPDEGRCWHCKRWTKKDMRVGVPVRMRDDKFHHEMIVDIEGCACNYSCAYAYLKDRRCHDIYSGRIILLRKIFELLFPGQELRSAPDFTLHKDNGGGLTDEMFDCGSRSFVPNPCLKYRLCSAVFEAAHQVT